MILLRKTFAIYDDAAEAFSDSFAQDTIALGMRFFGELCDKEGSPYYRYPQSYSLFYLGTYDLRNAQHTQDKPPLMIMNGKTGPCLDSADQQFEPNLSLKEA